MNASSSLDQPSSRRDFLGRAAALAACSLIPGGHARAASAPARKPNSVFDGVRIGCITYSFRPNITTAQDTLQALVACGLSEVELMGGPIQAYAGFAVGGGKAKKGEPAPAPIKYTDAQREAQLAKCRDLRKMFNDAGVNIHLHKIGFGPSDEEIEFNFLVAKALGCVGITTERNEALAKRVGPFADKHRIWLAFHNHTTNYPVMDKEDPILAYGEYIGFNFDFGHYLAGTKGLSPIPVIEKYHKRIVSLHMKDRTPEGGNLPWGQGKTPVKEILHLMRKEKWTFPADIELEYKVPADSTPVAEVTKCVQFCRAALA